jgi:hypothetical protein
LELSQSLVGKVIYPLRALQQAIGGGLGSWKVVRQARNVTSLV